MHYVVIFKAQIRELDAEYEHTAQYLRVKTQQQYHCQKFEGIQQQDWEITLSYWNSLEDMHGIRIQSSGLPKQRDVKNGTTRSVSRAVRSIHLSHKPKPTSEAASPKSHKSDIFQTIQPISSPENHLK